MKKRLTLAAILIALTSVVLSQQNCGGVPLVRPLKTSEASTLPPQPPVFWALNPPEEPEAFRHERLVILLDESSSSEKGTCPSDIQYEVDRKLNPDEPALDECRPGFDSKQLRLLWAQQWTDQITQTGVETKILIQAFSRRPEDFDYFAKGWLTPTQVPEALNKLKTQVSVAHRLTTSLPLALNSVTGRMISEIEALGPEEAMATRFQVLIVSDGVPRPRIADVEFIITQMCSSWVRPHNGVDVRCQSEQDYLITGYTPFPYKPGWCIDGRRLYACSYDGPYQEEIADIRCVSCAHLLMGAGPTGLSATWGDPIENTAAKALYHTRALLGIKSAFGVGSLQLKLIQPNPGNINPLDNLTINDIKSRGVNYEHRTNHLQAISDKFKITIQAGTEEQAPVRLNSATENFNSEDYEIGQVVVVNLNAQVGKSGMLEMDSDGDGLNDEEERLRGSDPSNPRSISPGCLDGITASYGCQQAGCDSQTDAGNIGLNECERQSAGLSAEGLDDDADTLPLFVEILYGASPSEPDHMKDFTPSDGYNNRQSILRGASPWADLSSVPESSQILRELIRDPSSTIPKYSFEIKGLPLVQTLSSTGEPPPLLFRSGSIVKPIPADLIQRSTAHVAGINQLIIYIRVLPTRGSGAGYWLMKRMDVDFLEKTLPPLDLSTFKTLEGQR